MPEEPLQLDALDILANEAFPGLVVRKDLLRRMRTSFGVPAFVIEFLLGKYCASTDEKEIAEGLEFVRETLASKYVKPDEREAVKSSIKQHSTIDTKSFKSCIRKTSACKPLKRQPRNKLLICKDKSDSWRSKPPLPSTTA